MNKAEKLRLKDEDMAGLPEIPEGFKEMVAEKRRSQNVIWYRKKGGRATYVCGQCGAEYELHFRGRWKEIEEPVKDNQEKCRKCGSISWLKPRGKTKSIYNENNYYLWQRQGAALICRIWGEERTRIVGAPENIQLVELGRAYFEPGRPRFYSNVYAWWKNLESWTCGKYYNQQRLWSRLSYGDPRELSKGTKMEYWDLMKYREMVYRYHTPDGSMNIFDYLDMYEIFCERPELELMIKNGYTKMAKLIINRSSHCKLNYRAKNLAGYFRVYPERLKNLKAHEGSDGVLMIYQAEKASGSKWSDDLIESIITFYGDNQYKLKASWDNFVEVSKYMTVIQAYNRVNAYYMAQKKKEWTTRADVLREYKDYLNMRAENGYDMTNSVYLHPRNLKKAHNEMVKEQEERKSQERIKAVESKYPKIRKKYSNLNKKWHYEGHGMVIRPARSAGEIVKEGQQMHHCVGRDSYLQRHNNGHSFIFLMRKKGAEEKPYVTIECDKNGICQWYCAHDRKTDDKETLAALQEFESKIKGEIAPREKVAV